MTQNCLLAAVGKVIYVSSAGKELIQIMEAFVRIVMIHTLTIDANAQLYAVQQIEP